METANAKPKEELLDEQQQQQQKQQLQQPSKEQTLTAQLEPSADAATDAVVADAAVATAEVTSSSPGTASSSASPTLRLGGVAPLVVTAADVDGDAADATDSTAMNAAGSSDAAAPITAEAATLTADKNVSVYCLHDCACVCMLQCASVLVCVSVCVCISVILEFLQFV